MTRPKDDIAGVAVDLAAGQDHLLKLVERQKEREQEDASQTDKSSSSSTKDSSKRDKQESRKKTEADRRAKKRAEDEAARLASATRESAWVTPSFKVKASRTREIDQVFFAMRSKGEGHRTKQAFVDEALDWLIRKYQ